MAVVINSETKLTYDDYETVGSFHDEVHYKALQGVVVDLSRVW